MYGKNYNDCKKVSQTDVKLLLSGQIIRYRVKNSIEEKLSYESV